MTIEQQIEKALEDLGKGLATRDEVIKLIDEKTAEHLQEQQQEISEIKGNLDVLTKEIKTLRKVAAASKDSEILPNSVWGTRQRAKNFGLFILASVARRDKARKQLEEQGIEFDMITGEKAMGEDVQTTGGALVPVEFIPNLITLMENYGVFRRNAQEYPMGSDFAVAPEQTSDLTVYCPGAGTAITASDLGFRSIGMTAKKWATLTAIDSELDEDSAIALGEIIGRSIARAFAKKEDSVGFLGDGTSTYFGHTGITGALRAVDATIGNIKSLVVGAGNAYSELTLANFETLVGTLPDFADDGEAKFYCHRLFYLTVMVKLALAAGGANATEISMGRGFREKTFLSYPVEFSQVMPKAEANSQICCILGNLRLGAYLGDRRRLSIARSNEVYFANDQIGIRGTERVAPTVFGVGDTTNAGPICGLITAAS